MKLKNKEDQSVDTCVLLRRGSKITTRENTKTKCGAKTEGRTIQRLPFLGIHPYTDTKPRHYCGCQEVHADRSLIQLSPERLCQILTNTDVDAHSQPLD